MKKLDRISILLVTWLQVHRIIVAESFDDSVLFRINWGTPDQTMLDNPNYSKLQMTSDNDEKFECMVPITQGQMTTGTEGYKGPNALELIWPLFKAQACLTKDEPYWSYEICHGRYIKQYHQERDGKTPRQQEFLLGQNSIAEIEKLKTQLTADIEANPRIEPLETTIADVKMPYFAIEYDDGTMCDISGLPRRTRILYVCYEEGRQAMYRIKEIYSCEYEIIILTSYLCEHPAYRPQELLQTNLHCFSKSPAVRRPKKLHELELESLLLRTQGGVFSEIEGGSLRIEVIKVAPEEKVEPSSSKPEPKPLSFPAQPSDNTIVQAFLKGYYCLHGGSGWWKYELCHGLSIDQYHEERDGTKKIITLGTFNEEKHKQWIIQNPSKRYVKGDKHIVHFYSSGDLCEETGRQRQAEVKLSCKHAASAASVTLYLLEPKTCEYIIGVESPIVCSLINNVDAYGLFRHEDLEIDFGNTVDRNAAGQSKGSHPHPTLDQDGDL